MVQDFPIQINVINELSKSSLIILPYVAPIHLHILGEHPFKLKENISSVYRSFLLHTYMHNYNYTTPCGTAASNAPLGAETKTLEPH